MHSGDCACAGDICYLILDEADISVSAKMAKEFLQQMSTEPNAKLILMSATPCVPTLDPFIKTDQKQDWQLATSPIFSQEDVDIGVDVDAQRLLEYAHGSVQSKTDGLISVVNEKRFILSRGVLVYPRP